MLDWHETPEALGPPVAGPFRFSKQGTRRRREARAVYLLAVLTACALFVLAGAAADGPPGAAFGIAAALGLALAAQRLERSYFARICPSIEIHAHGICFCDARRPVYFRELDGLLFGGSSVFLAFRKGLAKDESAAASEKRPFWERAIRRRAYWEIPLEGFADAQAVKRAVRDASGLRVQELSDEIADAIRSRTTQGIARVPAAAIEQRF
jgi:hypothetical protein